MNRHVNAIANRLSLRPPQRRSLEILDHITELVPPRKGADLTNAMAAIQSEFPLVTDFEREFPSLCFALATGVGKTRLMGAFISYLHLAHGLNNFFVMAPNLTIYNKLIADFTPNTPKYVFNGIAEFAVDPPEITTGDSYDIRAGTLTLFDQVLRCRVNIFNISKINSEVRGGRSPRIKRLSEYIGESYFDYLARLEDLVLIMDESHRYRASAGVRAINELKPVLGLELTATPFVETHKGPIPFKNVILDYPLGRAMADGFVKEPAVVTRKNFTSAGMSPEELERMKLEDGIRLHESVKVELETYARETGNAIVKPFLLVIARDTTHAGQLKELISSDAFFEGRYKLRVLQVDSSRSGAEEDEMVATLLRVERTDEPTEIVIHVNMLKEGWDVTNLYTIVPLRAANARILIEQSIGRGLRLPYGRRTGVTAVDRLNIIAHDRFQEIIDEASRPNSPIRLQQVILEPDELRQKTVTVVAQSQLDGLLGIRPQQTSQSTWVSPSTKDPVFATTAEQNVAQIAYRVMRRLENQPLQAPSVTSLQQPELQARVAKEVAAECSPQQLEFEGTSVRPSIAAIVAKTADLMVNNIIDIPRILVVPRGEVKAGYRSFTLDLSSLQYPPVSYNLWIQLIRTNQVDTLTLDDRSGLEEEQPEDYVIRGLVDYDDVSYDEQADLLYDLAGQTVRHLRSYLPSEDDVCKVLRCYQRKIAHFIHVQMQPHYWEETDGYEVKIRMGVTTLKPCVYTASDTQPLDFHHCPADKSNMAKYVFSGFQRCLYPVQKFQSDSERKMAVILERESLRWFKPARGQFQIHYRSQSAADPQEYQPDFVAETDAMIYMLEPKARKDMEAPDVLAKRDAAVLWCSQASDHAKSIGGKPWSYVLVPHDVIAENMTLSMLATQFGQR